MKSNWYEKLEFKTNPFEIDPFNDKTERTLFGRDKETKEVIYRIMSQNMLFIEGGKGTGKTALLKQAIKAFKGQGKIIYVDSNAVNKNLNIEELLVGAKKYSPTKEKYPKDMILLIDNVESLSKLNNERIKYFFDQNYLRGVIFTGKSIDDAEFTDSVKSRIGSRIIKLAPISEDTAVDIIMDRLSGKNNGFLKENVVRTIYKYSDGDIKKLLINSFLVCEKLSENSKMKITDESIQKIIFGKDAKDIDEFAHTLENEEKTKEETTICKSCGEKLQKIGEHFRCPDCDTYCTDCGAVVSEDDNECPECGVKFE